MTLNTSDPVDYGSLLPTSKKELIDSDFYETGLHGDLLNISSFILVLLKLLDAGTYPLEKMIEIRVKSYEEYMQSLLESGFDPSEIAYVMSKDDPAKVAELNIIVSECNNVFETTPFDSDALKVLLYKAHKLISGRDPYSD